MNFSDIDSLKEEVKTFAESITSIIKLCNRNTIMGSGKGAVSWEGIIRKLTNARESLEEFASDIEDVKTNYQREEKVGVSYGSSAGHGKYTQ